MHDFTRVKAENIGGGQTPIGATHVGDRLYLTPISSGADDYTLFYYGTPTPLGKDNATNSMLKRAPDALLYGALLHSAPYVGDDPRLQTWLLMFARAKASYKKLEFRARTGGGPLAVRPDFSVPDDHLIGTG
jgi:hypothetical protein